jgi:hypothetical protein
MGDGTYAVRFFRGGQATYVRVDADLPTYAANQPVYADLTSSGELWVALAEKAYAEFRTGSNDYATLNGGWMGSAYNDVTGAGSTDVSTSTMSTSSLAAFIKNQLDSGHALTAATSSLPSSPLVGGHAYMVKSLDVTSQGTFVTVYNPWGWDGGGSDNNLYDGLVQLTVAQFQAGFTALSACPV